MKEALDNCSRFDENGQLNEFHQHFRGVSSDVQKHDMFAYKDADGTGNICNIFGEMESWNLTEKTVSNVVASFIENLPQNEGIAEAMTALANDRATQADREKLARVYDKLVETFGVSSLVMHPDGADVTPDQAMQNLINFALLVRGDGATVEKTAEMYTVEINDLLQQIKALPYVSPHVANIEGAANSLNANLNQKARFLRGMLPLLKGAVSKERMAAFMQTFINDLGDDVVGWMNRMNIPAEPTTTKSNVVFGVASKTFESFASLARVPMASSGSSASAPLSLVGRRSDDEQDAPVQMMGGRFSTSAKSLRENVGRALSRSRSALDRLVRLVFLFTRIEKQAFDSMIDANVALPFGFILFRPFQSHEMSTLVLMKGGPETGHVFWGHTNCMLSQDGQIKTLYGNYTYYSKAIIHNEKHILLAENVFYRRYHGGGGTKFFTPEELVTLQNNQFVVDAIEGGRNRSSLICAMIPASEDKFPKILNLKGSNTRDGKSTHYTTAQFYCHALGFEGMAPSRPGMLHMDREARSNSLCCRGYQRNVGTSGKFDDVVQNTGHHGQLVFPGCGRIRNGLDEPLRRVTYTEEVYGGK